METLNARYQAIAVVLPMLLGGISGIANILPKLVGIESGTATFYSGTNVPGIEVKGTSNALTARAEVTKKGSELTVQGIEASLPIGSLATGMKTRDEHMRKYIFEGPDGQTPDIRFTAGVASCPAPGSQQEFLCQVNGNLSIRGLARPLAMKLKVKEQSGATAFRVVGDGIVKLSDYGIVAPSQFGVKCANEVGIHLDFTGKQKTASIQAGAGGQ